jgi:tRNA threonylcarbamoyladenosine biosynthesis protein TsaB
MKILAIDTTTPDGSIAVLDDERLLAEIGVASATTHSSRLLGSVQHLLAALRLDIRDIDAFAVSPGPGSFTGLRIGLSTVKALAFASGKPVAPVSSLAALAWKLRDDGPGLVAPVIDAKKGEIYAGLFEIGSRRPAEVVPQGAYAPDSFISLLPRRKVRFIGGGLTLCRDAAVCKLRDKAVFPARTSFIAAEGGRLGLGLLASGHGVAAERLEPLYFRASQAEDKR